MDNDRGLRTYLGPIIRIAVLILLVALIAFFVVRWARNRNNSETQRTTTETAQIDSENTKKTEEEKAKTEDETSTDREASNGASSSPQASNTPVPSGIDDGDSNAVPSTGPQAVPETGMGENLLITGALISLSVYLFTKNLTFSKQVSKQ